MKSLKMILPVLLLLISFIAKAQNPVKVSLKEALTYAHTHNKNIQSAYLNKEKINYQIKEAKSIAYPQLKASANLEDNLKLATQLIPGELVGNPGTQFPAQFGTKYTLNANLMLEQMLYDQSYWAGLKAIKKADELNNLEINKTKEEVIFQVAATYYQAQVTSKQREITKANLDKNRQLKEITQKQYENGIAQKIDYDRLKVNEGNLQSELDNLENGYKQSLNNLKYLMGISVNETLILSDSVQALSSLPSFDKPNFASRLDMQLISKQKELEILQMKVSRSGYYPSLSAYARYSQQALSNDFNFNQKWFEAASVGIKLNVPIFDGFQKRNKVQQSQIRIKQLDIQSEDTREYLQMEYDNTLNQLKNKQSVIKNQEANMQLAEEVYQITQEQYKEGLSPLSDLLNAENALKDAQTVYLQALIQAKIAELEYIKSKGYLLETLN